MYISQGARSPTHTHTKKNGDGGGAGEGDGRREQERERERKRERESELNWLGDMPTISWQSIFPLKTGLQKPKRPSFLVLSPTTFAVGVWFPCCMILIVASFNHGCFVPMQLWQNIFHYLFTR